MGVPKFFRWISERYPCLSEIVREYQIPTFDNLYLDMNGIIHTCSHPNDFDPHFRISEDKIFHDIFHYIEVLFRMIQPQKVFFMAIDGVAPRAKMNQQRGRRFRSAKEAEVLEKKAQERGESLPTAARFDSNCITPGTVFMAKLHEQLKYFVTYKISQDPMWQKCKVILSGHETPGEGEHKIMDFIRYMKCQPDYDPNTRHCLYGLDADLLMLGLCSHEPHFSLLREEVKFVRAIHKRTTTPEEQTFLLLHLSLLREYLELEFSPLKSILPFPYDIEKIIDDWVLMGFLVGNDFIPPLPDMHIANGALPILYQAYIEVLPTLGGYINETGTLNLERFQKYMEKLSAFDFDQFKDTYADLKYFEGKTGRKVGAKERKSYSNRKTSDNSPVEEPNLNGSCVSQKTDNAEIPAEEDNAKLVGNDEKVGEETEPGKDSPADSENAIVIEEETVTCAAEDNGSPMMIVEGRVSPQDNKSSSSASTVEAPLPFLSKPEEPPAENSKKKVRNPELAALIKKTRADLQLGGSSSSDDEVVGEDEDYEDYDDDDEEDDDDDGYGEDFHSEFLLHKREYYINKLEYAKVTDEVLRSQAEGYVRAIQWNLNYYYNGVCSWSWFYPHHYAPYISDIQNFSDLKLEFEMGEPFLPFQQLLAVLPAASKTLLPEPYQTLMVENDSPIISYYPSQFKTDLNGKKQDWEAVVLIPFIDETILLKAMEPINELLSEEEKKRNSHGPALVYTYTEEDLGPYAAPEYFPPHPNNHAKVVKMWRNELFVEKERLVRGPCEGAKLDVYFPGFPTLKHLEYKGSLEKRRVKVFEMASRGDNMIIEILNKSKPDIKDVAEEFLGKSIYVEWPHLIEARVTSVSSKDICYSLEQESQDDSTTQSKNIKSEELKGNLSSLWVTQKNNIKERYINRLGVEIGHTEILVHCTPIMGRKYIFGQAGRITLEKQWANIATPYALQATVKDISVYNQSFVEYKALEEVFPLKTTVFLLGHPHYGSRGEVTDPSVGRGRVKVSFTVTQEPNLEAVKYKHKHTRVNYMTGNTASQRLSISTHLFSRVSGTIFVTKKETFESGESKTNVGLNLKFNKKNEEIPGYTKKENGIWLYSYKAVDLVASYMEKFPELFDYLSDHTGDDIFNEDDLFPDQPGKVSAIADWLKEQPYTKVERQKCGALSLDPEIVQEVEQIVDSLYQAKIQAVKTVSMQVKAYLLYKSSLHFGNLGPDPAATYNLFDRIVSVRENYTVPLGYKGTIIGIKKGESEKDTLYNVLFDKPFAGGLALNCSANRGYHVPSTALINLSYGLRSEQVKAGTKNLAPAQPQAQSNGLYQWNKGQQPPQHNTIQNPQNIVMSHPNSAFASWRGRGGTVPSASQQVLPPPQNAPQASVKANQNWRQKPAPILQPQVLPRQPPVQRPFGAAMPPGQQPAQLLTGTVPPPHLQQPIQLSPQKPPSQNMHFTKEAPSSEFQTMWNELQRQGSMDASQKMSSPFQSTSQYQVNDSGTEILKKMLRIPEDPTEKPKPPLLPPQQQTMKQVSVQEMFEHARAAESKNLPTAESSIMKLLRMFQLEGLGLPRYSYVENKEENTVTAHVSLPNMRVFTGASASTREQAGENAAKVALNQLTLERSSLKGSSNNGGNVPLTNNLPSPPQQWCWPQSQQIHHNRFHSHQEYQQNKQDWRVRNDAIRPFANPPLHPWMHQQHNQQMPMPQQHIPPFVMQQQQHQVRTPARTNWREEPRQQGSPFVPLQAVKQQVRSKPRTQPPHQTPQMQQLHQLQQLQQQLQQQPPQQLQLQPQRNTQQQDSGAQKAQPSFKYDIIPKKPGVQSTNQSAENKSTGSMPSGSSLNQSDASPGTSTSVKTPKVARPKKCRLAANFSALKVTEGQ